jgi:PiT family inorganic phosphate transporter
MSWMAFLVPVLTFVAVMLVAGNNLSVCVGPAIGSRIITKRFGMLLGAVGFSLGLVLQGSIMTKAVIKILPNIGMGVRAEALLVGILIFVIADYVRVPLSFSMSLVGFLAGFAIATEAFTGGAYVAAVVAMWAVAPLIAIAFSFYLIRFIGRSDPRNVWRRLQTYKVLLIVLALSSSFVLGANTIGLIVATGSFNNLTVVAAVVAIFVGAFFLSAGAIRRVSQEIYLMRYPNATAALLASTVLVGAATLLGVPLSNSQALESAVFGTGISYKFKFVSIRPFVTVVLTWVLAPLLSFAIGLILGFL